MGLLDGTNGCSVHVAVGGALPSPPAAAAAAAGAMGTLTTRGAVSHITTDWFHGSTYCKPQAKEMKPADAVTSLSPSIVKLA